MNRATCYLRAAPPSLTIAGLKRRIDAELRKRALKIARAVKFLSNKIAFGCILWERFCE